MAVRFIESVPGRCAGRPCLRGRRLWIGHVVANICSDEAIAEYAHEFDVDLALVRGAVGELVDQLNALRQWPITEPEAADA